MNTAYFSHLQEWLNLSVRWFHLIAGISWIGSSFYFMWLDASLEAPPPEKKNVEGELWMVHSGGFYQVERRLIGPGDMPQTLHWFKWEAMLTLLSGLCLIAIVFYLTGGALLTDPAVAALTPLQAIGVSAGGIALAWVLYDALWQSALGQGSGKPATAISFGLLFGVVYGFCHLLSGRAAFVHVGAMLGTLMVLNVWVRILPAQQKMVDATKAGKKPDLTHSARAKKRSVHNSYLTLPVLFMMLSNHFPSTYGSAHNWIILCLLIFVGAAIRHVMIVRMKNAPGTWWLVPAAASVVVLIAMTAPTVRIATKGASGGVAVPYARVRSVMAQRCLPCHSVHPTDDVFRAAPNGVMFDLPEQMQAYATSIKQRAVDLKTMPLANKTEMTDEERALIGTWVEQGAGLD